MIDFKRIQSIRDQILLEFSGSYKTEGLGSPEERLNRILDGLIGGNKFVTVFNFQEREFTIQEGVLENLGYASSEFTIFNLNNDTKAPIHITHPEDLEHKVRYDTITYELIAGPYELQILRDYYKLKFRVMHKNGKAIPVERSCHLFSLNKFGVPESQIDIWEIASQASPFVVPSYYTPNHRMAILDFYTKNCAKLGLKFSPRECQVLVEKSKQLTNAEIQDKLKISSLRTVEKHIDNIIKKVRAFCKDRADSFLVNSIHDALTVCMRFGLFPIPEAFYTKA